MISETVIKMMANNFSIRKHGVSSYPRVPIIPSHFAMCEGYTETRYQHKDYGYYETSSQNNSERCRQQDLCGKMGEVVAGITFYSYLGIQVSAPDFLWHPPSKKGWTPDLFTSQWMICVKSCEYIHNQSPSWIFQYQPGVRVDEHVFGSNTQNTVVAFVVVDMRAKQGRVMSINPVDDLKSNDMFEEPYREDKKSSKKSVYWKTLCKKGMVT